MGKPARDCESRDHDRACTAAGPFCYWGKAGADDAFHPLVYHSLDVAAVGAELLHQRCDVVDLFTGVLAVDRAAVVEWITFWIALHDLGKFASSFQG